MSIDLEQAIRDDRISPLFASEVASELERLRDENASDRAIQGDAEHRALERAERAEAKLATIRRDLERHADGHHFAGDLAGERAIREAVAAVFKETT